MPKRSDQAQPKLVKTTHPAWPDREYYVLEPERKVITELMKAPVFLKTCDRPCTKIMTLLPKTSISGHAGVGYQMINVDGFRWINAYIISDPLSSSTIRGFTLEISFSVNPFVYGVGVRGESSFFFNFDTYYDPTTTEHKTIRCMTSDLVSPGGGLIQVPRIGGVDLTHILRVPVMGSYIRASAFNEDTTARSVEVTAYLTT